MHAALHQKDCIACLSRQLDCARDPVHVATFLDFLPVATRLRLLATPKNLWVAVLICLKRVLQIAFVATWLRQKGIGVVRL